MSGLVACPFCRGMFAPGEAQACPECGLKLESLSKLPPSQDVEEEEYDFLKTPPHMENLPWTFAGRGRAALIVLAVLGLGAFFCPWVHEAAPEIRTWSGFDFARKLGWMWAPAVAWFVMLPLVASRRSIYKMRGARVAVGFLAGITLMTIAVRLVFTPQASAFRQVRFEWGWGLYASGVIALAALAVATCFGGRVDDVATKQRRRGDEILH